MLQHCCQTAVQELPEPEVGAPILLTALSPWNHPSVNFSDPYLYPVGMSFKGYPCAAQEIFSKNETSCLTGKSLLFSSWEEVWCKSKVSEQVCQHTLRIFFVLKGWALWNLLLWQPIGQSSCRGSIGQQLQAGQHGWIGWDRAWNVRGVPSVPSLITFPHMSYVSVASSKVHLVSPQLS